MSLCTLENVAGLWGEADLQAGAIATLMFGGTNGNYTAAVYAEVKAGVFDEEQATGKYTVSTVGTGSLLTVTPQTLTCPTLTSPQDYPCAIVGGLLVLETSTGNTTWAQNPQNVPAATATTLGCFGSGDTFTPMM